MVPDAVQQAVKDLVTYLQKLESWSSAHRHYKLEEWAAVEAFHFFRRYGWRAAGVVPYETSVSSSKWCDLYARCEDPPAHVWFELKAAPMGCTSKNRTRVINAFVSDVRALANRQPDITAEYWSRYGANPPAGSPAERPHAAWFAKAGPEVVNGMSVDGHVGVAILLLAAESETALDAESATVSTRIGRDGVTEIPLEPGRDGDAFTRTLAWRVDEIPQPAR
jgi:hypothetical protein